MARTKSQVDRHRNVGGPCLPLVAIIVLLASPIVRGEKTTKRVELEVVSSPRAGPLAAQEWLTALQKLPLDNIRIRTGTGSEKPSIEYAAGTLRVTGVLSAQNVLLLPGRKVRLRDRAGLASWIESLFREEDKADETFAFGLTAQQLVAVHDGLKPRLASPSNNRNTMDVVDELTTLIELPIMYSAAARSELNHDYAVTDELQGLSSGTALAAVLRPVGLVFYPTASGKSLTIATVREYEEAWPIGWPTEKKPAAVAPVLFRRLEVEIDDTSLTDVLQSLRSRMEMPFVFDQNGMARQRISPPEIRVSLTKRRTYYKRALDLSLRQAELRAELRVDENESPFIWIYPRRTNRDSE